MIVRVFLLFITLIGSLHSYTSLATRTPDNLLATPAARQLLPTTLPALAHFPAPQQNWTPSNFTQTHSEILGTQVKLVATVITSITITTTGLYLLSDAPTAATILYPLVLYCTLQAGRLGFNMGLFLASTITANL